MFKPELLLPAGTLEAFFAAMEGGADAVYLGLKKFNARNRARNFSYADLQNIMSDAHSRGRKVYVTLNTLIKNNELSELVETLSALSQCRPDALIIQDLAVANLVQRYFPDLNIHASTQMSVHNSMSCNFLKDCGFSRVVQFSFLIVYVGSFLLLYDYNSSFLLQSSFLLIIHSQNDWESA